MEHSSQDRSELSEYINSWLYVIVLLQENTSLYYQMFLWALTLYGRHALDTDRRAQSQNTLEKIQKNVSRRKFWEPAQAFRNLRIFCLITEAVLNDFHLTESWD